MKTTFKFFSLIFLFVFLFSHSSSAQKKKDIRKHGIKSVTVTTTTKQANGQDKTIKESFTRYKSDGEILADEQYDSAGVLKKNELFKYNKNNDIIEQTILKRDGTVRKIVSKYDSNNKKTEETVFDASGRQLEKTVISYNAFGEKTSEITNDASGKITGKTLFSYDKNGMKTEKKSYDGTGNLMETKNFIYAY